MIKFTEEIERFLQIVRNTNNKEQNFQAQLVHFFTEKYGNDYNVEVETSRADTHVKGTMIKPLTDSNGKDLYRKKEIDLLIYNKDDHTEKYAAELKWIYHRAGTGGWCCLDSLEAFSDDAVFVEQLVEQSGFTETCSVVVYDFNPTRQVKRVMWGTPEQEERKRAFLGGEYHEERVKGTLVDSKTQRGYPFVWKKVPYKSEPEQNCMYYIITFNNQ